MSLPIDKIQAYAARRLTEQQIADVLDIQFNDVKNDPGSYAAYREAIRIGRAKGEAELRAGLYKRAKEGDVKAYLFLMRREQEHKD
ncbi:hypothetical protein ABX050_002383 [Salmonella enterica]|uniref:Uncharacterized protein n=2 Tax=Salmonella enterica TaxID=28901 RepID=A0A743HJX0_SALER|nr:hypothetical protein [Salmonella enterica subsp. enterica serovar Agbeni]EAZ5304622.1 hypothetical protein [Salmonella enterica]EDV0638072.1 hypothetical protein [Salmonella enterica subsp. enterica serovar Lexington]EEI6243203.1 hypothetical protein [Salmonella enterica subsp. enterica serovar Tudu]EEK6741160.1 hypothetical protein [Salmonella enterica subsp. enterica serovar Enteritidis]EGU6736511.1 hypothetical protein [Salmonella enterica subsp. enterica]